MSESIKYSESVIANELYRYYNTDNYSMVVPNTSLFSYGESDVIVLSKAGVVIECEIKISRNDFKRDFKKPRHKCLLERGVWTGFPQRSLKVISPYKENNLLITRQFYYVVPAKLVSVDEVPEYAGLLYIGGFDDVGLDENARWYSYKNQWKERGQLVIVEIKKAPQLHKHKLSPAQEKFLARGLSLRYWQQRLRNKIEAIKESVNV